MKKSRFYAAYLFIFLLFGTLWSGSAWAKEATAAKGDSLQIQVEGETTISHVYTVDDKGCITLPEAGDVQVTGQTATQIKETVAKALSAYIKEPQVTVTLQESTANQVVVYGEVKRPGTIPVKDDTHLVDVIGSVEGLTVNADDKRAVLFHKDSDKAIQLDINSLLKGDMSKNISVVAGDTLYVPARMQETVSVTGQVKKPGEQPLTIGMNVMEAVQGAGGFNPEADQTQVRITKKNKTPILVNLQEEPTVNGIPAWQTIALEDGDTIWVPENKDNYFNILGGVKTPGQYPIKKKTNIMDAITLAGGLVDRANQNDIRVAHAAVAGQKDSSVKVNMKKLFSGDLSQNIEILPGDTISVDVTGEKKSPTDFILKEVLPLATTLYYLGRL